jgi:hypothetical protein
MPEHRNYNSLFLHSLMLIQHTLQILIDNILIFLLYLSNQSSSQLIERLPEFLKNILDKCLASDSHLYNVIQSYSLNSHHRHKGVGGARRDRTADPLRARQVLSQLSYGPNIIQLYCKKKSKKQQPFQSITSLLFFSLKSGGSGWIRTTDLTLIRGAL